MTTIDRERSATGAQSLAIIKRMTGYYYGAYLSRTPFRATEHPVVEFDVMLMPGCQTGVMFPINARFYVAELCGFCEGHRLGRIAGVADDGRWRHVRFDLAELMRGRGLDPATRIPYIATRKTGQTPPDAWALIDNFQLHSGRSRKVRLMWKPAPGDQVEGYSFVLDRQGATVPDEKPEGAMTETTLKDLAPGRWRFHVSAVDAEGRWGPPAHFEIEVRE